MSFVASGLLASNVSDIDFDQVCADVDALELLVARENGEDDLGTKTGATTINFATGDYWNKRLMANVDELVLTFDATLDRSYEFTYKQRPAGNGTISTTNGTWIGAVTQPASAGDAESRYRVTKSGATYFVSRVG